MRTSGVALETYAVFVFRFAQGRTRLTRPHCRLSRHFYRPIGDTCPRSGKLMGHGGISNTFFAAMQRAPSSAL
jgi:hypothetical protein